MIEFNDPNDQIAWYDDESFWVSVTSENGIIRHWCAVYPDGTRTGEVKEAERTYPVPLTQWEKEIYNA